MLDDKNNPHLGRIRLHDGERLIFLDLYVRGNLTLPTTQDTCSRLTVNVQTSISQTSKFWTSVYSHTANEPTFFSFFLFFFM